MYTAMLVGGAVQYLLAVVLARKLGAGDFGIIILATTISGFAAASTELGIIPVVVRFRAQLEASDPVLWAAVMRIVSRIVLAVLFGISVLACIALLVSTVVESTGEVGWSVTFGLAMAGPTVLLMVLQGYLQAERRFTRVGALTIGTALIRMALVLMLFALGYATVLGVLCAYFATVVIAAVIAWYVSIRRVRFPQTADRIHRRARALIVPYFGWTGLARTTAALNGRTDIFLLSVLSGTSATGIYGAAAQSAAPAPMLATAVGEVSFPYLTKAGTRPDPHHILRRWAPWLPILVVGSTAAATIGAFLLPLIFGPEFSEAAVPFAVLLVAYGIQIWMQPIGSLLYACDRQRQVAGLALLQTLLLVTLDLLLIPPFGALGPALAILITTLVTLPILVFAVVNTRLVPAGTSSNQ
jgi:O-antigen/teichoic acid export membrane protein